MAESATILIVDDDPNVRDSYTYLLEDAGFTVRQADGISTARKVLESGSIDVALLDMKMEGETDGLVLHRVIQDSFPGVQTIIITAYAGYNHAVQALKTGAVDYLSKAASTSDILQAIHTALKKKQQETATGTENPTELSLICSHSMMKEGLLHFCATYPGFVLSSHYRHLNELLVTRESTNPILFLVCASCNFPDSDAALDGVARLTALSPGSYVLILNHTYSADEKARLLHAGVHGFVPEEWDTNLLYQALSRVLDGEVWAGRLELSRALAMFRTQPGHPTHRGPEDPLSQLSPRERDVLRLLSLDFTNKEIAARLSISERTVKTHLYNMYQKLGVHSRSEAVAAGFHYRILP